MERSFEEAGPGSGWRRWQRVVDIPTRLSAPEVRTRLARLLSEGPTLSGVKGGATEDASRFRVDFYGGRLQPDIVIRGEILGLGGQATVRLRFHAETSLGLGMVVLLGFCILEVVLNNLTAAEAALTVGALGILFAVLSLVVGPLVVTQRVSGWIEKALRE
jgi:hypothetical protein